MTRSLWTPGRLNLLLSHVESHKGENGLYMTQKHQAMSDAARLISDQYPCALVAKSQVASQLHYLSRNQRAEGPKDRKALFRFGRIALKPRYSKASLEKMEAESRSNPGSEKQTLQSPAAQHKRTHKKIQKTPNVTPSTVQSDPSPRSEESAQSYDLDPNTQNLVPMRQEPERERNDRLLMAISESNRRSEKVIGFLRIDPNQYLPSQEHLDSLKGQTVRWIRDVSLWFLETAGINDGQVMDLYGCHSSLPFFNVCKRLYNVNTAEELLTKSALLQMHSPLVITDFVRALAAAAITHWVFEGKHCSLLGELSQPSKAAMKYQSILADLDSELHEQIVRKRNYEYVKNEANIDAFIPNLSLRFAHTLIPFLRSNQAVADGTKAPQWPDAISKAFKKALELHGQVFLLGPDYTFEVPRSGDEFDRNSMVTESDLPKQTQKKGKVHVVLFPALVQNTQSRGEGGADQQPTYLFKAIVILQ